MIYQCDVSFTDDTRTFFVSTDGQLFYEQHFPESGSGFSPMKYTRRWLKDLAGWDKVKVIEFTERKAD